MERSLPKVVLGKSRGLSYGDFVAWSSKGEGAIAESRGARSCDSLMENSFGIILALTVVHTKENCHAVIARCPRSTI